MLPHFVPPQLCRVKHLAAHHAARGKTRLQSGCRTLRHHDARPLPRDGLLHGDIRQLRFTRVFESRCMSIRGTKARSSSSESDRPQLTRRRSSTAAQRGGSAGREGVPPPRRPNQLPQAVQALSVHPYRHGPLPGDVVRNCRRREPHHVRRPGALARYRLRVPPGIRHLYSGPRAPHPVSHTSRKRWLGAPRSATARRSQDRMARPTHPSEPSQQGFGACPDLRCTFSVGTRASFERHRLDVVVFSVERRPLSPHTTKLAYTTSSNTALWAFRGVRAAYLTFSTSRAAQSSAPSAA